MPQDQTNQNVTLEQQKSFANMHNQTNLHMQSDRKQRELYIGNLPPTATEIMLKELFTHLITACDDFDPSAGPPVLNAQIAGGGQFAFVEFRDEVVSNTAIKFNGIELGGKPLKAGHPNGYIAPEKPVQGMRVPFALLQKCGLASEASGSAAQGISLESKKQRELYVGNLAVGIVTPPMLKELFTVPLQSLPGEEKHDVPPVVDVRLDTGGKFAFLEFRDENLATTALSLFSGMELCGREMRIARPAGYEPPPAKEPAPFTISGRDSAQNSETFVPAASMPPDSLPLSRLASKPVPARSICLENLLSSEVMADEAELTECIEDIRTECESFGPLASFDVPKPGSKDAGKCFIEYRQIECAIKAYQALDGREFDGNVVKAHFLQS